MFQKRVNAYDPGFAAESSIKIVVTPNMAKEWLDNYRYPGNRTVSEKRKANWVSEMKAGRWKSSILIFARALDTGRVYMINGQHRLLALIDYGYPLEFWVIIEDYPDYESIREQYNVIDTYGSGRSIQDIAEGSPSVVDGIITKNEAKISSGALRLIADSFKHVAPRWSAAPTTTSQKVDLIEKWAEELCSYFDTIRHARAMNERGFISVPTVAVALITNRFQLEKSVAFWYAIADDNGLERGCPIWLASRYIRGDVRNKGISESYRSRYLIKCWNAWYKGEKLEKCYPDPAKPVRIEGTPYRGVSDITLEGLEQSQTKLFLAA